MKKPTPPILCIDKDWPATSERPDWVAICAADWDTADNYFSLSGHIGAQWGQYVISAVNAWSSPDALRMRLSELEGR